MDETFDIRDYLTEYGRFMLKDKVIETRRMRLSNENDEGVAIFITDQPLNQTKELVIYR